MAEGVAHAPDASVNAVDSRADCDARGKGRRPLDRGEVADVKQHRHFTWVTQITVLGGELIIELRTSQGDHCSRVCGPPAFSSLLRTLPASRGARSRAESSV